MKSKDTFKLIVFFIVATGIYVYATEKITVSSAHISPHDAHKIWKSINTIENKWYTQGEKTEVTTLSERNIPDLIVAQEKYEELKAPIDRLIHARKDNNYEQFLQEKEVIMKILRPIWAEKLRQEREKRAAMGWFEWIKDTMSRTKQWLLKKISKKN